MWHIFILLSALVAGGYSHGRVLQPPSRASAWRFGYPTKPDYDDDGVNCGGFSYQWTVNKGRCGICGDRYDTKIPRAHELGGKYGDGIIVANYQPGSIITVTIDLTTSHLGYWEMKLCPDPNRNDQECFDHFPLDLEDGGNQFYPKRGSTKYYVNYRLPPGLVCDHCVLQWRYIAGNNWGTCKNGTQGLGCGNQEQFGACSDISIGMSKDYDIKDKLAGFEDVPYPLLNFLRKGYFESHQGMIHWYGEEFLQPRERPSSRRKTNKYKNKNRKKNKKKTKPYKWKKILYL